MTTSMPVLETDRIMIRPFKLTDLASAHELLDLDGESVSLQLEARRSWLEWTVLGYDQLAALHQPPFGDRAIILKETGELAGACGYAPVVAPLNQIPALRWPGERQDSFYRPEVGLYWAVHSRLRGRGIATEAGRLLIEYAFESLHLARIVATTDYNNAASAGVMRKLGMQVERNPEPEPLWFQIIGVLVNPGLL